MKLHILAITNPEGIGVKAFSSRSKMTETRSSIKDHSTTYMFPPISVERSVEGILKVANLVNDIHVLGPVAVLEKLDVDN